MCQAEVSVVSCPIWLNAGFDCGSQCCCQKVVVKEQSGTNTLQKVDKLCEKTPAMIL